MIYKTQLELGARYHGSRAIAAVYYGARLVWEAISSCFGKGLWINLKPWQNSDAWKD